MATEKLELGFDENAPGNWFVLDNAVRGLLDNTVYVLSGAQFYDVTQYMTDVSMSRGKNRELDRFNAGHLTAKFNNKGRIFDPTYSASPFYGQIVPRRSIQYSVDNVVQFSGIVDDWDLTYQVDGNSDATVSAYDGFAALTGQTLVAGTATSELSGARINKILDSSGVQWSYAKRLIDVGDELLQADVIQANQDVLSYINLIENTEFGMFYVDKNGRAVWKGRNSISLSTSAVTLADNGTGIRYSGVKVVYGSELLYNQSYLTRLNGGTATGNDYTSQAAYGVRTISQTGLLHNTDLQMGNLAAYLVNNYKNPEFRFESMDFALHDMSLADRATLLNLDIGGLCKIIFTPNGITPSIMKYGEIIGIDHDAHFHGDHTMSIRFQTLETQALILDDTVFGLLDLNILSY